MRDTVTWGSKLSKNRSSMDSGSLRYYITTNTFVVHRYTRSSSMSNDGSLSVLKKLAQTRVLYTLWFELTKFWIGRLLNWNEVVCVLHSSTYLTAMFLWLSLGRHRSCLPLLTLLIHTDTDTLTHTVRRSQFTQQLRLLKVLKLLNAQESERLWMAEVYRNTNSIRECLLKKAGEI